MFAVVLCHQRDKTDNAKRWEWCCEPMFCGVVLYLVPVYVVALLQIMCYRSQRRRWRQETKAEIRTPTCTGSALQTFDSVTRGVFCDFNCYFAGLKNDFVFVICLCVAVFFNSICDATVWKGVGGFRKSWNVSWAFIIILYLALFWKNRDRSKGRENRKRKKGRGGRREEEGWLK